MKQTTGEHKADKPTKYYSIPDDKAEEARELGRLIGRALVIALMFALISLILLILFL